MGDPISGDPASTSLLFEPEPRFRYPVAQFVYVVRTDGATEMAIKEVEVINTENCESGEVHGRIYSM